MKKNSKKKQYNNSTSEIIRLTFMIIIICAIGILIGVSSYTWYYSNKINHDSKIISVYTVDTQVEITTYSGGLNGDTDALKFGKVPLGGSATRYLNIYSINESIVQIEVSGDIAKFLSVDKNDFIISKNSNDTVTFNIEAPNNAIIGNYSGIIKVTFLKISN
ncbi:MAG: hypothetical protein ACP5N1_07370 [Candidatus Woesearchaeota archaeon]